MIAFLQGTIVERTPTEIVIDVNGVGYSVSVSLSTSHALESHGNEVKILTYLHVREDLMQLYGFATESERQLFRMLISITGIGPKMAQGILSGLSPVEFREAVATGNILSLTSISGVGRKTAERLIIELRDKIGKGEDAHADTPAGSLQMKLRAEAIIALMSLGYTRLSAEKALRAVLSETASRDLSLEELIKTALRHAGSRT
ncbi:MAG TPA: Holliday junction branch migration protein RuvA [Bacteroidota bacterium]|nr:Holliday junction branch migration protein RuvA [Bacteroidota bacterium]